MPPRLPPLALPHHTESSQGRGRGPLPCRIEQEALAGNPHRPRLCRGVQAVTVQHSY